MSPADKATYLADVVNALKLQWPEYQRVNIVCDGHSVPAGYFDPPMVDSLNAHTSFSSPSKSAFPLPC